MLSGASRVQATGRSLRALGRHLVRTDTNEKLLVGPGRGLAATDLAGQLRELAAGAAHARTDRPLWHVHLDPTTGDTPASVATYWRRLEAEFGLKDRPYAAVLHRKNGRPHEHRVYRLTDEAGRCARLSHDYARRQRVGAETAHEHGLPCPPLSHARAVEAALRKQGKEGIANYVRACGETTRPRRIAPLTPEQRQQQERTATPRQDVGRDALAAWQESDSGEALRKALATRGLRLAAGDRGAVILDQQGGTHSLSRTLGTASKAAGARIGAAEVKKRLDGMSLAPLGTVQPPPAPATTEAARVAAAEHVRHCRTAAALAFQRAADTAAELERCKRAHTQRLERAPKPPKPGEARKMAWQTWDNENWRNARAERDAARASARAARKTLKEHLAQQPGFLRRFFTAAGHDWEVEHQAHERAASTAARHAQAAEHRAREAYLEAKTPESQAARAAAGEAAAREALRLLRKQEQDTHRENAIETRLREEAGQRRLEEEQAERELAQARDKAAKLGPPSHNTPLSTTVAHHGEPPEQLPTPPEMSPAELEKWQAFLQQAQDAQAAQATTALAQAAVPAPSPH